ncbi:FadR/GntR family transcriptional regulator [Pseudactinotalea suaedae]|uniref:FadR/GntR family transcriptional regulator n=1 Tax=Pseudactinotalea suaedae TaxID=1524924 RepID=UPI001391B83B|nr:FadR/GntR family transcriptional regulator [Pseudactinotalea suaedae]
MVDRSSLTDQTASALVDYIRGHGLVEGDPLPPIDQISASLGVSRTVAREAVAELSAQGLLLRRQGSGTTVAVPGAAQLSRIFAMRSLVTDLGAPVVQEFRTAIELAAVRLAASRISDDELDALKERLGDLESARELADLFDADVAFHQAIADASGNDLLRVALASLTPLLHEHRSATWDGWKRRGRDLREGVAQHRRIFEALQQRDVDAAITAMSDHLDQASSSIVAHGESRRGPRAGD